MYVWRGAYFEADAETDGKLKGANLITDTAT